MNILNLRQGTPEWHATRAKHFTASEAAAMMGDSAYLSRLSLLQQKHSGIQPEVSDAQQRLFDKGHAAEAAARPIVEQELGEELYPVTGCEIVENLPLLASMDGLTMAGDTGWEHKLWNEDLAASVEKGNIPKTHYWQLEHQLLVSGADKIVFTVSDGGDKSASIDYVSVPERRKQLIAGWKQFAEDIANFKEQPKSETLEAEVIRDLPAITYRMDGLTLSSNLDVFKQAASELVEQAKKPLQTDQDFANAEALVKVFKTSENKLKVLSDQVLGEVADIDQFVKDLREVIEKIRQARLSTDKQVKQRKDEIRKEILTNAITDLTAHFSKIEKEICATLPELSTSIPAAMKNKKTLDSLREAASDAVAKAKIEANDWAEKARLNQVILEEVGGDHKFLFSDWPQIAFMDSEALRAIAFQRINDYVALQQEKAKQADDVNPNIETNNDIQQPDFSHVSIQHQSTGSRLSYEPLDAWPSDASRSQNDELNRICEKLEEAEDYIAHLEFRGAA